jgi:hypothetical protein
MSGSKYNGSLNKAYNMQRAIPSSMYPQTKQQAMQKMAGPELADHIFGVSDYYGDEDDGPCEKSFGNYEDHLTEYNLNDQFSLQLENPNELLGMYKNKIRKYDRAYAKMAEYALQWHNLLEDIEENEHLEKMFKDLQIMRKLCRG